MFLAFTAAMQFGCATVIRDLDGKYSTEFEQARCEKAPRRALEALLLRRASARRARIILKELRRCYVAMLPIGNRRAASRCFFWAPHLRVFIHLTLGLAHQSG